MVKKWVTWDEWYPVNMISEHATKETCHDWQAIEFTDAEVADINDLFERFEAWQEELQKRMDGSKAAWEAANPEEHARKEKEFQEYLRLERARGRLK